MCSIGFHQNKKYLNSLLIAVTYALFVLRQLNIFCHLFNNSRLTLGIPKLENPNFQNIKFFFEAVRSQSRIVMNVFVIF